MFEKVNKIKREVARKWGISVVDLEGPRRSRTYIFARHEAMFRVRKETPLSYPEIGYFFGRRDHTTVLYAVQNFERKCAKYKILPNRVLIQKI